jgi:mannose-6-phosphate isomerase
MAISPRSAVKVLPLLDAKPWGGRRLEFCGVALPAGATIGEAHLTSSEAIVTSGVLAGHTLGECAAAAPEVWVGARGLGVTGGRAIFPLLIKLIDAQADLSIQVHPDDAVAAAADLGTGKTEAWHILDAQPGSVLYLGLAADASDAEFRSACRQADGSAAQHLRQVVVEPGMTVVVPAGTLHAIGAGLLIYEIQQPSNVTFRLDDWGRRDALGQPRELHHDAGFAAVDPTSRPAPIARVPLRTEAPRRELLAATRFFALERIELESGNRDQLPLCDSPRVLTCLTGVVRLTTTSGNVTLSAGETAVLPVGLGGTIVAPQPSVVLHGWVPDLERDVIAPATVAGAWPAVIQQLGIGIGGA